jgi:UDP-N-acetyl-D-glucosamine/UDP-N-acetyl-D-galactosamine dehydrogenase
MTNRQTRSIAVVGLGYVGLPIAIAFGKIGPVVGFDINKKKIEELQKRIDRTGEVSKEDLAVAQVRYTSEPADLKSATFIIVAVPTPINRGSLFAYFGKDIRHESWSRFQVGVLTRTN